MELTRDIEKYILKNVDSEGPVLSELRRETNLKVIQPRMLSGHLQGLVLSMLSKMVDPENILEIGTFTGYSAICLAKGLRRGGFLYTLEINDELESIAAKYFKKAGIENSVKQIIGDAKQIIAELNVTFNLVFIDADKREYSNYYNLVFDKVAAGGYIIADNTLWDGKVAGLINPKDTYTKSIVEFNELVSNDPRVEKVILPIRDGMTIIRKK